jgi:hypothetical protein
MSWLPMRWLPVRLERLLGLRRLRLGLRRLLLAAFLSLVLDRIVETGSFYRVFPRVFTSSPTAPMMLFSFNSSALLGRRGKAAGFRMLWLAALL